MQPETSAENDKNYKPEYWLKTDNNTWIISNENQYRTIHPEHCAHFGSKAIEYRAAILGSSDPKNITGSRITYPFESAEHFKWDAKFVEALKDYRARK